MKPFNSIRSSKIFHSSLFCCTVLCLLFCCFLVFGSLDFLFCVNLFVWMFYGLSYFNHRIVLNFWTAGWLLFGRFINYNIKVYTKWFTSKTLNGVITNSCIMRIIGDEFFLLWNSVSVEPTLNSVVLVGNLFFDVGRAKSSLLHHY